MAMTASVPRRAGGVIAVRVLLVLLGLGMLAGVAALIALSGVRDGGTLRTLGFAMFGGGLAGLATAALGVTVGQRVTCAAFGFVLVVGGSTLIGLVTG
jgi:hypothetical protein